MDELAERRRKKVVDELAERLKGFVMSAMRNDPDLTEQELLALAVEEGERILGDGLRRRSSNDSKY